MIRIITFLFVIVFSSSASTNFIESKKQILVLNSYHQGFNWSDDVMKGIIDEFDSYDFQYEFFFEYMDARRFANNILNDRLFNLYKKKYSHRQFDVIITSDDNAFNFMVEYGDSLFGNTPVVFCGVNYFRENSIAGKTNFTGVVEEVDLNKTIDFALSTHPNTKEIIAISDQSYTAQAVNRELIPLFKKYKQINFKIIDDLSITALSDSLSKLTQNTIVLFLVYSKDKDGRVLNYSESISAVANKCKKPIYSVWDFYLGSGIIGGMLTNGKLQGQHAAQLAYNILSGKEPKELPIVKRSPNRFMFDLNQMKKFGIKQNQLPQNSIVINQPSSFFTVNKNVIWIGLSTITVLGIFVILLSLNIKKRKLAEASLLGKKKELEESLGQEILIAELVQLLNSTNEFGSVIDTILQTIAERLNVPKVSIYTFNKEFDHGTVVSSKFSELGKNIIDLEELNYKDKPYIKSIVLKNQSIISNDLSEFPKDEKEYFTKRNIRSILIHPLKLGDRITGLMSFSYNQKKQWRTEEASHFQTLANMIANAWERSSQFYARIEAEQKNVNAVRILEESSKLASIGVMAAGITHEINQPLNAIKVNSDGILYWNNKNKEVLPITFTKKLKNISSGVERINEIINHMRSFWVPSEKGNNEIINLNKVVKNSINLISRQISDHGIKLLISKSKQPIKIVGNKIQIEQIIINLTVNAIHSLDNSNSYNKTIEISTSIDDGYGKLIIKDNGIGLPTSNLEKIFDPFYSTKNPGEGSGLGLAIVKNFVDRFNAEINYFNNEGSGATFEIVFKLNN